MTISDEIIIIANQLANQGKKPTVALVKNKLRKPAPLPLIISILRNWTHDPKFISLTDESEETVHNKHSLSSVSPEIEKAIKRALQPIEAELAELKILVNKLTEQQK